MNRQWIGIGFVGVVAAFLAAKFYFGPNPHRDAQTEREMAMRVLTETVAARHPGKRALVLSNPFTQRPGTEKRIIEMEEAGLRGLRAAAGDKMVIGAVVYPELRPEARDNPRAVPIDPETSTPLSYVVAIDAFDRAAGAHPDCEVIISLIGLPVELDKCEIWKREGSPVFALLLPDLRMVGGPSAVAAAFKSGKLSAIILRKPGGPAEGEPPGKDFKYEVERRFIIVTAENAEDAIRTMPSVFSN